MGVVFGARAVFFWGSCRVAFESHGKSGKEPIGWRKIHALPKCNRAPYRLLLDLQNMSKVKASTSYLLSPIATLVSFLACVHAITSVHIVSYHEECVALMRFPRLSGFFTLTYKNLLETRSCFYQEETPHARLPKFYIHAD